ncbi:MAG: hypothetical protein IID32_08555 [Planctomycetes bacterium]|nr:hypothetical protein [Planctomycetota bacterium]
MRKLLFFACLGFLLVVAGCQYDVVLSPELKALKPKRVYVESFTARNNQIGDVLRDVVTKEFLRKRVVLCSKESATLFVSGAAFFTDRAVGAAGLFGSSTHSSEAIESFSLVVKDIEGNTVALASYDNVNRYGAVRLGREVGAILAIHLR